MSRKKTSDYLTAQQASIQVSQVAAAIVQGLQPLVVAETSLNEGSQEAVVRAVGTAVWNTDARMLLEGRLEPSRIAKTFTSSKPELTVGFGEAELSLYYRLLNEVATFLISIANKLPGFEVEAFKKVIESQVQLLGFVQDVLAELKQIAEASIDSDKRFRDFETRYRQEIAENLNQMDHLGLERLSDAVRKCPLDIAYVGLSAVPTHKETLESEAYRHKMLSSDALPIEDILAKVKYLVIKGQAGYGKTTLLRWLAVRMAKGNFEQDSLREWQNSIPFYIRLRDFARKELPAPERFLQFGARNIEGMMPAGWVHHHLFSSDRGVILIDGVDELSKEQRPKVKAWIGNLQTSFPSARILVTSRPSAIHDGWLEAEHFHQVTVTPLDDNDKNTFINSWHNAVKRKLISEAEKAAFDEYATHLKQRVAQNRMLNDLAGTPLLLSALCAINWERNRVLPESRVQLYRELISMLLARRDVEREINDGLDSDVKQKLLQKLAYWMMLNDKVTATKEGSLGEMISTAELERWGREADRRCCKAAC